MTFHLGLFGTPELRDPSGGAVHLRTRKQLTLLIYLALEGRIRPVSRDRLVELLWSDTPRAKARHSLSQALTAIRTAFGCDAVRKVGESVVFVAPVTTDLDLQHWNGADLEHPLYELDVAAGAELAHWIDVVRQRCAGAVRTALAGAIERARLIGDAVAVHESATTLYTVDPFSDIAAQALAERLMLEGDASGALRFLRRHIERADEELGKVPHGELKRLLKRMEAGNPTGPAVKKSDAHQPAPKQEVFIGRERELAQLEGIWARARQGSLQTCLLTGPAGIGKSSLLRRFATTIAARAFPSLIVSCQEIGAGIPFATVADLMQEMAKDSALGGTDPMWLAEATRVYPALKATYPGIPEPPPAPAEAIRVRLAEALYHMVESVSETGPVLIGLDDTQHLDPVSRDVLHLLARRWEAAPILLVGTCRAPGSQPGRESTGLGVKWESVIEVLPMESAQIVRMIAGGAGRSPDEKITREIAALAQGNPYFAEMLLSDWQRHENSSLAASTASGASHAHWEPPATMRLAFARLFDGMPPDARDLLEVLAVAGRSLTGDELNELMNWDNRITDSAVMALMHRAIIRFEQGGFAFKNELHRAFVYYAMPEETRKYHHARIARYGVAASPDDFQTALETSHHLLRAGMHEDAVNTVERGSEIAIARGAPREAEKAIRAVVALVPPVKVGRLGLLLARALDAQGRYRETLDVLRTHPAPSGNSRDFALAAILRAQALRLGRLTTQEEIVSAARTAVASARLSKDQRAIARALQVQAEAAYDADDARTLHWAARSSARIASNAQEHQVKALCDLTRGFTLMVTGNLIDAREAFVRSERLFGSTSFDAERLRALNGIGISSTGLGEFLHAKAAFERAIGLTDRTGDAVMGAAFWGNLASVYEHFGFFQEAAKCVATALRVSNHSDEPRARAMAYARSASLAIHLGNREQTKFLVETAESCAAEVGIPMYGAAALVIKAEYLIAQDEQELAWPVVEQAVEIAQRSGCRSTELTGFERLRRQWTLATQGYDALLELWDPTVSRIQHVIERLEIEALHEWAAGQFGGPHHGKSVLLEIESRGLFGVLARLVSLHTCPAVLPRKSGESSAQLIARLFPDPVRGNPPFEIQLDQ